MTAISKITSKGQTTVPQAVRAALKSKPGDLIAWEIFARGTLAFSAYRPPTWNI